MIISQTPLRISLFGGGSDFSNYFKENIGMALATTINKYVYVIVKKRFDDKIRLGYSITETVDNANDLKHELAREAIKFYSINGVEISTLADVPGGTGLGSSSSVTVGLLHALKVYAKSKLLSSTGELALKAIEIEKNILNKPIGNQDQIIATYGGFKSIEFFGKTSNVISLGISPKTLDDLDNNLMLWYTNLERNSSDILKEQDDNVLKNKDIIQEMVKISYIAKIELMNGKIDTIGTLLDESWQLKKSLSSKISNALIDELYEYAISNGASGGKISGAGGGGFLLTYCPLENHNKLRLAMNKKMIKELPFSFESHGSKIIFNND